MAFRFIAQCICVDNLSWRAAPRFDRYLMNICNMDDREIREFKLHFLYHVAEILTRKDFWEVHTEFANNLQSTYELCVALRREFTTPMYDCGRFI